MPDPEGSKELAGIARSIDELFSGQAEAPRPRTVEDDAVPDSDPDAGVEPPPTPPNVEGETLTGAPVLPDMPEPAGPPPLPVEGAEGPPPLPDDPRSEPAPPPPPPGDDRDEPPAAGGFGASASAPHGTPSDGVGDEPAPTRLDLAVDAYIAGDVGKAGEIRAVAEEMLESREVEPVARSVGRLAVAAGEPPDESVRAVAESIASPIVLSRLARRMGAERDEARRQEYYQACRTLGQPMAVAIRDDLAESTDRLARRVHCEALVEMGPAGRSIIEEMAQDDNRFLVRNAVAILGDTGGDRAVELVTSALANPDPRVRREALLSLAKLGDEESGDLVLGLLEDSDREVRIAAATAAGELHVERALRSVIRLLDDTKDPDEAIPLIRALGHLGDPGAVPSIEKHARRTLLSRPRTDVRIAAYTALNQIGTPHARRLLNQAVSDKEPEVKAAVKAMLGMR